MYTYGYSAHGVQTGLIRHYCFLKKIIYKGNEHSSCTIAGTVTTIPNRLTQIFRSIMFAFAAMIATESTLLSTLFTEHSNYTSEKTA